MDKEKAIDFARLMESYLNIPSFMCESIEGNLINEKYKDVIEYILLRRNELERKENYKSEQDIINMKEYLIVYIEYEEITDENGYVINKIPYIKNEIIKANNIKEIIEEKFFYEVLNIIEIGDSNE